jgi:hypothetical protein
LRCIPRAYAIVRSTGAPRRAPRAGEAAREHEAGKRHPLLDEDPRQDIEGATEGHRRYRLETVTSTLERHCTHDGGDTGKHQPEQAEGGGDEKHSAELEQLNHRSRFSIAVEWTSASWQSSGVGFW